VGNGIVFVFTENDWSLTVRNQQVLNDCTPKGNALVLISRLPIQCGNGGKAAYFNNCLHLRPESEKSEA
jgi:hypothetical protein